MGISLNMYCSRCVRIGASPALLLLGGGIMVVISDVFCFIKHEPQRQSSTTGGAVLTRAPAPISAMLPLRKATNTHTSRHPGFAKQLFLGCAPLRPYSASFSTPANPPDLLSNVIRYDTSLCKQQLGRVVSNISLNLSLSRYRGDSVSSLAIWSVLVSW